VLQRIEFGNRSGSPPQEDSTCNGVRRRIGILTLHYGYNYGALLQSHTTAGLFNGEIVDHRYNGKIEIHEAAKRRIGHLESFLENELPLSPYKCVVDDFEVRSTWDYIERTYDLLVCGSDEIWKVSYETGIPMLRSARAFVRSPWNVIWNLSAKQRDKWFTPFPNVYWACTGTPMVSFAASSGDTQLEQIPSLHRWRMARRLGRFCLLGVRDRATMELVGRLDEKLLDRTVLVPDPVFSLDPEEFAVAGAMEKLEAAGVTPDGSTAFVHVARNRAEAVADELRGIGLRPLNLLDIPFTPLEWCAAIRQCVCGVTDAMHPLIVSLVSNVPCVSVDMRNKSRELRVEFGIDEFANIRECVDRWPASVPVEVARRRECIFGFVSDALHYARGFAGAVDDAARGRHG
jgi:Polysaccharide pyruvyl transferase